LLYWARMSELTCDRAGLLTVQDFRVSISAIAKMAGAPRKYLDEINVDAFLEQARDFEGFDFDTLDKIAKVLSVMQRRHPWTVMRASELDKWYQSGGYYNTLHNPSGPKETKKYADAGTTGNTSGGLNGMSGTVSCPECGSIFADEARFCATCGHKLRE